MHLRHNSLKFYKRLSFNMLEIKLKTRNKTLWQQCATFSVLVFLEQLQDTLYEVEDRGRSLYILSSMHVSERPDFILRA